MPKHYAVHWKLICQLYFSLKKAYWEFITDLLTPIKYMVMCELYPKQWEGKSKCNSHGGKFQILMSKFIQV